MTAPPFPLDSPPTGFAVATTNHRCNIYTVGETPSFTLSQSGATAYEVRDFDGDIVSTGSVSGTTVTPAVPVGGWPPGWYRLYLTRATLDAVYGHSQGSANFVVIRDAAGFADNPAIGTLFPSTDTPYGYTTSDGGYGSEEPDIVMKGVMGVGPSRIQIGDLTSTVAAEIDPLDPSNAGFDSLLACGYNARIHNEWAPADPARPWPVLASSPSDSGDWASVQSVADATWIVLHALTTTLAAHADNIYVKCVTGTAPSTVKVQILYPNSTTVVETYDNLDPTDGPAAVAAINASSTHVKAFNSSVGGQVADTDHIKNAADYVFGVPGVPVLNIGTTYWEGVKAWVRYMGQYGVEVFEGPRNEPPLQQRGDEYAWFMRNFQGAVHSANPDALAVGPCPVDILDLDAWMVFLDAGGGDYCDAFSFHAYGTAVNGDLNNGRWAIETFIDFLKTYGSGYEDKLWFQTESTGAMISTYGVYHPRRASVPLLQTLLFEQYGLARERNHVWYDTSHGFWSYPVFLEAANPDMSLAPYALLYRVLAEETYGMLHHHRVDFGSQPANRIFLGSYYQKPAMNGGCLVIQAASYIPDATVTLTIHGATDGEQITVVTGQGVESTETVASGRITVDTPEIPTYVQLPTGRYASVYSVFDWDPAVSPTVSTQGTASLGSLSVAGIVDNTMERLYPYEGIYYSDSTAPDSASVIFGSDLTVDAVVVFAGAAWQNMAVPTTFTIDTWNGTTWTTRETPSVDAPSSFLHGNDSYNSGCSRETFWRPQWIFPVKLSSPVVCKGVRIHATALSYGGEPDAACVAAGGQGMATPMMAIQEISVLSASAFGGQTYPNTVLADSPVGYWRLGESSGTVANSEVNNSTMVGAYQSTPTLGVSGALAGDADTAATFTTAKDVKVTGTALLNVVNSFTIEAWVKRSAVSGGVYEGIYARGNVTGTQEVYIGPDNLIHCYIHGDGELCYSSVAIADTTTWHHVVLTKSASAPHLYLDGVDVTVNAHNFTGTSSSGDSFWAAINGTVDECALYAAPLSEGRVQAHYVAGTNAITLANTTIPLVEA